MDNKTKLVLFLACLAFLALTAPVLAAGENITTALSSATTWLTKILGGSLMVIGIAIVGIRMAMHDEFAFKKGVWVVVGGGILFLAPNIVDLIKSWAGLSQ